MLIRSAAILSRIYIPVGPVVDVFLFLFYVFVLGHGRSVAVMCALLVAVGVVEDWKNAERLIRERRPYIRMNSLHRKALEEWSKDRLSSPMKNREMDRSSVIMSDPHGSSRSTRTAKKSE